MKSAHLFWRSRENWLRNREFWTWAQLVICLSLVFQTAIVFSCRHIGWDGKYTAFLCQHQKPFFVFRLQAQTQPPSWHFFRAPRTQSLGTKRDSHSRQAIVIEISYRCEWVESIRDQNQLATIWVVLYLMDRVEPLRKIQTVPSTIQTCRLLCSNSKSLHPRNPESRVPVPFPSKDCFSSHRW